MDDSFWSGGFDFSTATSPIDDILGQPDVSLEDLLDHEDIIQECKYLNTDLIDFLSRPDIIEKLVKYVILQELPPEEESKSSPETILKTKQYSYTASELFACEVVEMLDVLFDHPNILRLLFSFLDQPPGITPGCCAYFCKVIVVLIGQKHGKLVNFIQETDQLKKILTHIGLYSVMELLIRVGWDDGGGEDEVGAIPEDTDPEWLHNANLVNLLVEKLDPKYDDQPGVHINAACCLVDVVVKSSPTAPSVCILANDMQSEEVVEKVFMYMFCGSMSCLTNTLTIAIVLVQQDVERRMQIRQGICNSDQNQVEQKESIKKLSPILEHVVRCLPKLMDYLKKPTELDGVELKTQYGTLKPPFGATRLKIIELMLALITCDLREVQNAVVENRVLITTFEMFFLFPWNNMLHGIVESMVLTILGDQEEGDEDDEDGGVRSYSMLKKDIFGKVLLLKLICQAWETNAKAIQERKGSRLGYMGHLLRISVAINSCCPDDMLLANGASKEEIEAWNEFREGQLARDVSEQEQPLGGYRPGGEEDNYECEDSFDSFQFESISLEPQVVTDDLYDWDGENDDQVGMGEDNSSDDSDDEGSNLGVFDNADSDMDYSIDPAPPNSEDDLKGLLNFDEPKFE